MRVIHKQQLQLVGKQLITLPKYSKILSVQYQRGMICVWYSILEGTDSTLSHMNETREIMIVGTGHPYKEGDFNYVDTIQDHNFVWHIFERTV